MALAKADPVQFRPLGGDLVLHRGEVGLMLGDTAAQFSPPVFQIVGLPHLRFRSATCCASRAEPVSIPAAPTYTSTSSAPWPVSTNSRT